VDGVVFRPQLLGGGIHGVERRQVERLHVDVCVWMGGVDAGGGVLPLAAVAYRQHHVRALGGQGGGGLEAEAGIGTGDDGGAASLVGNIGSGPVAHGISYNRFKRGGCSVWFDYTERAPRLSIPEVWKWLNLT